MLSNVPALAPGNLLVLGVVFQGSMNQVPGITDAGGNTFARACR